MLLNDAASQLVAMAAVAHTHTSLEMYICPRTCALNSLSRTGFSDDATEQVIGPDGVSGFRIRSILTFDRINGG